MPRQAILESLEALWGLGPRLSGAPGAGGVAWIERPHGFTVVEVGPRPLPGRGWRLYLLESVSLDSRRAARAAARLAGASGYALAGLKDACSHSYQYLSLREPSREGPLEARAGGGGLVRAWPLPATGRLAPGRHSGNTFRLRVRHTGDPHALCRALEALEWVPGYYGPQRFGVERPNTHYAGLLQALGMEGRLLREYAARYPLEPPAPPGDYESRALEAARSAASPWAAPHGWHRRIALDALRAYIFNRALSLALERGGPRGHAEHWVQVRCPGGEVRAPAARLPGAGMGSRSPWARLVRGVLEEEGAPWLLRLWRAGPFRPLAYPVCRSRCTPRPWGVEWLLTLPPGAYATVALREAVDVDWLEYSRCRPLEGNA